MSTTASTEHLDATTFTFEPKPGRGRYRALHIRAGRRGVERVVPPAGEQYAFDVERWERQINVYVSPTGRSIRVFVDGVEIPKQDDGQG